jgi:hypothetical protein
MQLKVFISSRLEELRDERAAVEEAVSELWTHENLPFTIWRWESAKGIPSGKHPDNVQSEGVRDSDIYVLIMGSEYGDFEYGKSPTHKEYDIACSKPEEDSILIYVKEVERREEKLEKWIGEIKNRHAFKPFINPDQLKDSVKTRLKDLWNKGKWKTNIPTIQSVLRKGETMEGDFFKKKPEWIDFEEGFVVERKEVDEIIKKLENDNIQLVLGEPASGKSVILKNIGFKLAKEDKDVYVMELKKHSSEDVRRYFGDILLSNEKVVFIVDDAHLHLSECERLVRDFKNRNLKAKLIIGSGETPEIRRGHAKEALEFEYLSKTDIHAEDVTEEMIKTFLKRKYNFSNERIRRVSKNLERYKRDLWLLSWALKAYNSDKDSVEKEEIYEKIKESIRNINAEDVFLPLSVFYRFEIPIERDFLEEQLEIEEEKVDQLLELSEIIETEEIGRNRMLSLNHSSLAELYFKTYQAYPDLGRKVRKNFQGAIHDMKHIEYCLFHQYMKSALTTSVDVVINLGNIWFYKRGGEALIKELVEDKEIRNSIKEDIERKEDIGKIGSCVGIVAWTNKEVGLDLANSINTEALLSKIEKEKDIGKIGLCVGGVAGASEEAGLKFVNAVSSKIESEENMEKVILCAGYIAKANKKVGLKFVDPISAKIEKEEDIGIIGWCVRALTDNGLGLELAKRMDVNLLVSKIEKEEDKGKIRSCISDIGVASKEVAQEIINRLNPKLREELRDKGVN